MLKTRDTVKPESPFMRFVVFTIFSYQNTFFLKLKKQEKLKAKLAKRQAKERSRIKKTK